MNKIYFFTIFLIFIGGSIFGLIIYNENSTFKEESTQHQEEINKLKQEQNNIDKEFYSKQDQKITGMYQLEINKNQQDEDNDGLTFEQEKRLGTSDNEKDSDGDGIIDPEDEHPSGGGKIYKKTVQWTHNEQQYTTQFGIAEDVYLYYKNQPRENYHYQDGRFAIPNEQVIQTIAKDITDVSISTGDSCKICIAINFVESMIYQYDIDYIKKRDWPKYAIETIIDERGDCEDTSFLMASILKALNVDVILLLYSDHMAVGVYCNCDGTYYTYKNKKYYFLESTGNADNWKIGNIWGKYSEETPKIIEI